MAKLPENFVKPSVAASARRGARSRRKPVSDDRGTLALESTAEHPNDVLIRLSREERAAVEAACAALRAVGQEITIEEMIVQVIGRWITATRAAHAVDRATAAASPEPRESIVSVLRRITEAPLRRWTELTRAVGRLSQALTARS